MHSLENVTDEYGNYTNFFLCADSKCAYEVYKLDDIGKHSVENQYKVIDDNRNAKLGSAWDSSEHAKFVSKVPSKRSGRRKDNFLSRDKR